ncbi:MAG: ABC transporter permease [Dehalococcoidales bacterium]|nr:ABC transporter permease [Dehalococcoidales bacterium]
MKSTIRAMYASFYNQMKVRLSLIRITLGLIAAIPNTAIWTWIAVQSGNRDLVTYIMFGSPLVAIWATAAFVLGWALGNEIDNQTYPFILLSRTSMLSVMMGRMLAEMVLAIPYGLLASSVVLVVSRQFPEIANYWTLIPSLILVVLELVVVSLILAPLVVLVQGRGGFFNAIISLGIALGGFVYPISRLPQALQVAARFLPMSWVMDSVWYSIRGGALNKILLSWGMSVLVAGCYLYISYAFMKFVEKRVRINGSIGI